MEGHISKALYFECFDLLKENAPSLEELTGFDFFVYI